MPLKYLPGNISGRRGLRKLLNEDPKLRDLSRKEKDYLLKALKKHDSGGRISVGGSSRTTSEADKVIRKFYDDTSDPISRTNAKVIMEGLTRIADKISRGAKAGRDLLRLRGSDFGADPRAEYDLRSDSSSLRGRPSNFDDRRGSLNDSRGSDISDRFSDSPRRGA